MPKTPLLGTIISFKDVTGNSCTPEQLKSFLSQHNRSEVLFLCALLNTALETWSGRVRENVHGQLVEMAFLPEHAHRLKGIISSSSSHPRVVFHRAQIIFIAKQAVLCCQDDETVLDRFRHPYWGGLGLAFLMANDLLHFDFADRDGTTNQQALIRMTHSIPLLESGITSFVNRIGRAWLMLKEFGPAPSNRSDFNIEEVFLSAAGLSTEEYLAFCVGMLSHYLALNFEQIANMEDSIGLTKEWFTKAHINPASVNHFLEDVSASPTTLATRFLSRNWGPLDMTWFRDKPVCKLKGNIFVALDAKYLAEKLDSGIFWRVHSSLPSQKEKEQLHNHWGIAFENYMNWLLEQACRNSQNKFYASPRYENGNEVCDAIIVCGSDAVFIEYKGSTFTAESKYKGDLNELAAEIEDNLIGTETKRKGIRQLAHAILSVFDKQAPVAVINVDLSRISTIFPVLVTREDIGGCWGISHYLQMKADGFFNRRKVKPKIVTPIFCLSSEGIEGLSAYLQDERFSHLLHGWYSEDPGRYWSFQTIENPVMSSHGPKSNSDLDTAFKAVFENARQALFPDSNSADLE